MRDLCRQSGIGAATLMRPKRMAGMTAPDERAPLSKQARALQAGELESLLCWHGVPLAETGRKAKNLEKWTMMSQSAKPQYTRWSVVNEEALAELRTREIKIEDTALCQYQRVKVRELKAAVYNMSVEKIADLEETIAVAKSMGPTSNFEEV